jgi:nicotinamide phosphoribosyltransferase
LETFRRIMRLYPSGVLSMVSDTWDLWNVLTNILPALKDEVMARDGKLVVRPDSGDPADILCGNPHAAPSHAAEAAGVVELLWNVFGGTTTATGHRLLDSHVGVIYGDSITLDRAREIGSRLAAKKFASQVVFGVGSYTYQHVTRDTFGTAIKATAVVVDGELREISKAPATDDGVKKSACGLLKVESVGGEYVLKERVERGEECDGELEMVFNNGAMHNQTTLAEVRRRLHPTWNP